MISIYSNAQEVTAQIMEQLEEYQKNIASRVFDGLTILEANIVQNIKSRSGLHVRSGALLNSIGSSKKVLVTATGEVTGEIGPEGIAYAAIHEFGGTTGPHVIVPRNSKVLAFMAGGKQVFSKIVNHPGSVIPARPYLGPAIDQSKDDIMKDFGLFLSMAFRPKG